MANFNSFFIVKPFHLNPMTTKEFNTTPNIGVVDGDYQMDLACDFNKVVDKTSVSIEIIGDDTPKMIKAEDAISLIDKCINTYLVKIEVIEFAINDYDRGFKSHISKEDKHRLVSRKHERCCFIKDLTKIKTKIDKL